MNLKIKSQVFSTLTMNCSTFPWICLISRNFSNSIASFWSFSALFKFFLAYSNSSCLLFSISSSYSDTDYSRHWNSSLFLVIFSSTFSYYSYKRRNFPFYSVILLICSSKLALYSAKISYFMAFLYSIDFI